ncbi:hypothetical protein F511_32384 [Dorcoceras hygrometricum]|uniref:Uncharacterized protein n=1 Tax=Dorcoceras hygrometricum TaxID=472368 RepID=A0A2Z7C644_9LAMI|nr:hypothetical protein F511_32384 [Dorcoceras hygrometricum]
MRRPTSLLRPLWPEPYRLDHPQVQPVPTDPATVPTKVHDGRTEAGTVLHAHGANMVCHLWLALVSNRWLAIKGHLLTCKGSLWTVYTSPSPQEHPLTEAMHKNNQNREM